MTLGKKMCVFEIFPVCIFQHSDWIWKFSPVNRHILSKCGKIQTRKTPNTVIFPAVLELMGKRHTMKSFYNSNPAGIYLLKINNRNARTRCELYSKLTIKTPEQRQWRRSSVFIVNFEHISHVALVFLLLTLIM